MDSELIDFIFFASVMFFMTIFGCVSIIFTNKVDSQKVRDKKSPKNEDHVSEGSNYMWTEWTKKRPSLGIDFTNPPDKITKTGDYIVYWKNGESEIMRFDAGESTDDVDYIFGPVDLNFPEKSPKSQ